MVGYRQTNQKTDTGKTLTRWPVFVDHFTLLGTALYTELKNKAVKRYYLVDAKNKVEAAINSLPNPGDPEAEALFAKAESTLTSSRRHLGDELYDQFRITLDDMKPEYVG